MAHQTLTSAYDRLTGRLNKFPQGAPPSDLLRKILQMLFSEREAHLVSLLPIRPFTVKQAAAAWKLPESEAQKTLETLAGRAILVDWEGRDGAQRYALPPPMAGFFEFAMMRVRNDIDQKVLAELFHQYITVEDDFVRALFTEGETQMGRAFVQEAAVPEAHSLAVMDYERASEVINTATHIGIAMCYCRHKAMHLGKNCDAPMDICMTFNGSADTLIRHGIVRRIEKAECRELLAKAQEHNLVQFGENTQQGVNFICNCCGCCCEAMVAARRFGMMRPVHTTNFLPEVDGKKCTGCGKCASLCPVEAMSLVSANDPHNKNRKTAKIDGRVCLGCGVCVRPCAKEAITLKPRKQRVITPLTSSRRVIAMAVERGKLQNLLFDHQDSLTHRALAAVFGAVLKLPPVKRAVAAKALNSRYLDTLIAKKTV